MAPSSFKQKAVSLLESFGTMRIEPLAAEADPAFTFQLIPYSQNRPLRDLESYRQHSKEAFAMMSSFKAVSKKVYEDIDERTVIIYTEMTTEMKDRGVWEIKGIFFFKFTEEGKVLELRHFADTAQTSKF